MDQEKVRCNPEHVDLPATTPLPANPTAARTGDNTSAGAATIVAPVTAIAAPTAAVGLMADVMFRWTGSVSQIEGLIC